MAYFHAIIIGFFAANIWTYFCVFFNVFNRKKYLWFLISSYCYYKHHIVEITYLYSLTCEYSVTKNKKKQTIHKYASYTYIKRPLPFLWNTIYHLILFQKFSAFSSPVNCGSCPLELLHYLFFAFTI